tara:strand:+ start:373 stop:534 length:162 start_codon:yes stop_codon:yes gene_type:complete
MPKNQVTVQEFKTRVLRLKNELFWEEHQYGEEARALTHKYINMMLNILDEYRY